MGLWTRCLQSYVSEVSVVIPFCTRRRSKAPKLDAWPMCRHVGRKCYRLQHKSTAAAASVESVRREVINLPCWRCVRIVAVALPAGGRETMANILLSSGLEAAQMAYTHRCRAEDMTHRKIENQRRLIDNARRKVRQPSNTTSTAHDGSFISLPGNNRWTRNQHS